MLFVFKRAFANLSFALFLTFFLCVSGSYGTYKEPYRIKTIVIDPGHGGHDSGCLGSSAKEKHIALNVALRLGELIEKKYPDIKVIYTRKTDEFVELHERAAIANRNHADLFICIHCNSGGPSAFGAETYVMGLHKTEDNLSVAKRENSAVLYEKDYKQKYDGFDPNSPEANIIFTLYQNAYLSQSLKFASAIQQQFEEYAGRFNRGVKQAGFLVLYKTAMPAVLIETGFLTNKTEEKYLESDKGQQAIASSIFKAFMEYKLDMETPGSKTSNVSSANDLNKGLPELKNEPSNNAKQDSDKLASNEKNNQQKVVSKDTIAAAVSNSEVKLKEPVKPTNEINRKEPEHKQDSLKTTPVNKSTQNTSESVGVSKQKEVNKEAHLPELFYTIQVAAIPEGSDAELKKFEKLTELKTFTAENGMTRVCNGIYLSHAKAVEVQSRIRAMGFSDAFVTPYYKGKRITVKEAANIKK
jgi:N-acetylmuramoyl-L-alanine amidase